MVRGKFVEPLPGSAPRKILEQLKPLFEIPDRTGDLLDLPILRSQGVFSGWSWLELPDWARRCVPRDRPGLFLPRFSDTNSYLEYDWWRAIDFFLSCEFERSIEARSGPTHSYAGSMGEKVAPAFDYAWVNRIVAFLKIWWARLHGLSVENHFGEVPAGVITLTHDVDALEKTARLRLKQSAFQLLSGNIGGGIRMLFSTEDYSRHAEIIAAEQAYGAFTLGQREIPLLFPPDYWTPHTLSSTKNYSISLSPSEAREGQLGFTLPSLVGTKSG